MTKSGLGRATRQYFKTTTLHGFKYLCSGFNSDRVCWLIWCVASACCAGVLCAVLWARFLHVPALLTLHSAASAPIPLPAVAICLPTASVARMLVGQLSKNEDVIRRLSFAFSQILQARQTKMENIVLLEQLLTSRNVSFLDAIHNNTPPCHEVAKRCHWQNTMVPCRELFVKKMTRYGVCCVKMPNKLKLRTLDSMSRSNRILGMVLQCEASFFFGCQFFTKYRGEDTVNPVTLVPGSEYQAQLTYTSVQDNPEELETGSCVSRESYSWLGCMTKCIRHFCGCSNPLRTIYEGKISAFPNCTLQKIGCHFNKENSSCKCLPSCKQLSTVLSLENSIMKSVEYTLDPLYAGLNVSSATVVKLSVDDARSKVFTRQPTDTWFTLLSSLGGVFNMFLGVGLFSALEFLFFALVRVPAAIKKSPEKEVPITHVRPRHILKSEFARASK